MKTVRSLILVVVFVLSICAGSATAGSHGKSFHGGWNWNRGHGSQFHNFRHNKGHNYRYFGGHRYPSNYRYGYGSGYQYGWGGSYNRFHNSNYRYGFSR